MLFAVPFGTKAMAQAVQEVRKEDAVAVYGVSEDEVERMRILLSLAESRRRDWLRGTSLLLAGISVAGL